MAFHSCLYHRRYFRRTWLYVIWWVSYQKQKLITLSEHLGSPRFFGDIHVAHLFQFSLLLFLFCLSPLYALCLILPVPLVCLFFRHDIFLKLVLNTINQPPKHILQFPLTFMCHLDDLVTPECLFINKLRQFKLL